MSKSSAIPINPARSPPVQSALSFQKLDKLPPKVLPLISTITRKNIMENRIHYLHERYRDRLVVANAMRDYQEYRRKTLAAATSTSIGILGANQLSRIFLRSPLFKYSLRSSVPILLAISAPFIAANELCTNYLEKQTSNLWRIHKQRISQGLQGATYSPSGNYADKMVQNQRATPFDYYQYSFRDMVTGYVSQYYYDNKMYRMHTDMEKYPDFHQLQKQDIQLQADLPQRFKKFDVPQEKTFADHPTLYPLMNEQDDGYVCNDFGSDQSAQGNPSLLMIDHGFDQKPFNTNSISNYGHKVFHNTYINNNIFNGDTQVPRWSIKLVPEMFQFPEKYITLGRHWRQRLGLDSMKKKHAKEVEQEGKTDFSRMGGEVQQYIQKCRLEEYYAQIKDVKIRPNDATSNVDKRPLSTLGSEQDEQNFYQYQEQLKNMHAKELEQLRNQHDEGKGQKLHHLSGTYMKSDGSWYHQVQEEGRDPSKISEQMWRQHYQGVMQAQKSYDLTSNSIAYDKDYPKKQVIDMKNKRFEEPYYKQMITPQDLVDFEKIEREGKAAKLKELLTELPPPPPIPDIKDEEDMNQEEKQGGNEEEAQAEEEEEEEDQYIESQAQILSEYDSKLTELYEDADVFAPRRNPVLFLGREYINPMKTKKGTQGYRKLVMAELQAPGVNKEYKQKVLNEFFVQDKAQSQVVQSELRRAYPNMQWQKNFSQIDKRADYEEAQQQFKLYELADKAIFGQDIMQARLLPEKKAQGQEQQEQQQEGDDDQQEQDPNEPIYGDFQEYLPLKLQRTYSKKYIQEITNYEKDPNITNASLEYILNFNNSKQIKYKNELEMISGENYRFNDDIQDVYEPWNRDHLDMIIESLPRHVFWDIKTPRTLAKQRYQTNQHNVTMHKPYPTFYQSMRYDEYLNELKFKRNVNPSLSFFRRDY